MAKNNLSLAAAAHEGGAVGGKHAARSGLFGLAAVGVMTLLFGLINWHWLGQSVVTYGWDRMDHLITSLVYNDIFKAGSAQSLYNALAYSDYYPPFVHFTVNLLYRFFGVNEDVAVMVNIFYVFLLFGATWSVARRLAAGRAVPLLAVTFLATFPMIFIMSRYLYLDLALTAMVAVTVALLLETERFTRRGMALLFGASMGLAFLIKWTAAAFLSGPLVFMLWRSGVFTQLVHHPGALRPNLRKLAFALAGAALINALWILPARAALPANPLGWGLYPVLTLTLGGLLLALMAGRGGARPPDALPLVNAAGAGAVALGVLSFWYLTNLEFLDGFVHYSYGLEDGRFFAFGKYAYEVTTEQLGPIYAGFLLMAALVWLAQRWRRTGTLPAFLRFGDTGWVLLLWVIVPYFIFSWRVSLAHSRFVMPFLPPFAVWLAAALWQWRPRWLRATAICALLLLAGAQFALLSFDALKDVRPAFVVNVFNRPVNLLAEGFFIQFPATGLTDPAYALAPEVLGIAEEARRAAGRETVNVGVLVNLPQLHEKHFLYSIYVDYPQVRLRELARNWREQPAYNQLFEMDYVLVTDTHSFRTHEASQEVARRIFDEPDDLFNRAYEEVRAWALPAGEQVKLFKRSLPALEPGVSLGDYQSLLGLFADTLGAGDAVVLVSPDQAYMLGLSLPAQHDAAILPLPGAGQTVAAAVEELADAAQTHKRIFLVSHNVDQVDPVGEIEGWLRAHMRSAGDRWAGSVRLTPYIAVDASAVTMGSPLLSWPDGLHLAWVITEALAGQPPPAAGGALPITLEWGDLPEQARKVSLQLLAADGSLLAQQDQELTDARQEFALLLPRSLAAGEYRLVATVYDPETLERQPTLEGVEVVELGSVTIP